MQQPASKVEMSHSIEHEFFKSLVLQFAPDKEQNLCSLLPEEEGAIISKLKTVPFDRYPNLIEELMLWHPEQLFSIGEKVPIYLRDAWNKMLDKATPSPFASKFVEKILFGILVRSGANRSLFVEKGQFVPLLKKNRLTIELLFELVSFRLMMQSSQFLITKDKRHTFFEYIELHPKKNILQSYFESFSKRAGQLQSGVRFIWSKWNGTKEELNWIAYNIGLLSLGVCIHKGTHLAFLLSKRLGVKEADTLSQNTLPSPIPTHIVKDMQKIVFDSMQFIQKNQLDQTITGERAHV